MADAPVQVNSGEEGGQPTLGGGYHDMVFRIGVFCRLYVMDLLNNTANPVERRRASMWMRR